MARVRKRSIEGVREKQYKDTDLQPFSYSPSFNVCRSQSKLYIFLTFAKKPKMQVFTSLLALVALVTPTLAAPVLEERAATTCGSTYYTATQVNQAAQKACTYYKAGSVCISESPGFRASGQRLTTGF